MNRRPAQQSSKQIFGLDLTHARADVYRALLEGVAYGVNDVIRNYREAEAGLERIAAVGGGTKNTLWSQAVSDISGESQTVRARTIGAAYGNCFLGALAIGDAASYRHWFTGNDVRLESVQNATDQARLAARTITGHEDAYSAVPWFWSDIGDMKLQMVGLTAGGDSHVVSGDLAENKFSIYHYAGDRLLGIESVNHAGHHMLGRKMLGAGFSPAPQAVQAGPDGLKAALAAFQEKANA